MYLKLSSVLIFLTLSLTDVFAQIKRHKVEYEEDKKSTATNTPSTYNNEVAGLPYFNFALGANIGFGGNTVYSNLQSNYGSQNVSYGNGIDFQVGFGYNFNEYIAAEFNLNYQFGVYSNVSNVFNDTVQGSLTTINQVNGYAANVFKFNPQIVMNIPFETFTAYSKFGPFYSNSTRTEKNDLNINNFGNLILTYEDVNSSGLGFSSSIGFKKQMRHEKMLMFCEANYIALTQSYERGSMVSATFEGEDVIQIYDISEREYVYVTTLDKNYQVSNPNLATQKLKEFFNFNSFGVKIGIIYLIN